MDVARADRDVNTAHPMDIASAAGFLADIDRMNLEIRDYLWSLPTEHPTSVA